MPIAATFRRRRGSAVENGSRGRSSPSRSGKTWTLNGPACVLRRDTPRVNFTLLSRGARRPAVADAWGPPAEGRLQTVEHPHVWLLIVRLVAHADRLKKGIGDDVAASLRVLPHGVIRRNPRAEPLNLPSSRGRSIPARSAPCGRARSCGRTSTMVYLPRMADAPDLTGKHILSPTAPTTC